MAADFNRDMTSPLRIKFRRLSDRETSDTQTYIRTIRPRWGDENFNSKLKMKIRFYRTYSNYGIFFV